MSGWAPTVGYVVQNQLNNLLSLPPDTTGARELIKALLLTLIKERAAERAELQGVGDYTVGWPAEVSFNCISTGWRRRLSE